MSAFCCIRIDSLLPFRVLGIELKSADSCGKHLYPPSHLSSPPSLVSILWTTDSTHLDEVLFTWFAFIAYLMPCGEAVANPWSISFNLVHLELALVCGVRLVYQASFLLYKYLADLTSFVGEICFPFELSISPACDRLLCLIMVVLLCFAALVWHIHPRSFLSTCSLIQVFCLLWLLRVLQRTVVLVEAFCSDVPFKSSWYCYLFFQLF